MDEIVIILLTFILCTHALSAFFLSVRYIYFGHNRILVRQIKIGIMNQAQHETECEYELKFVFILFMPVRLCDRPTGFQPLSSVPQNDVFKVLHPLSNQNAISINPKIANYILFAYKLGSEQHRFE